MRYRANGTCQAFLSANQSASHHRDCGGRDRLLVGTGEDRNFAVSLNADIELRTHQIEASRAHVAA
jgi:hypothetical protein